MEKKYVLAIDQSTQGTKGILFDTEGNLTCRTDLPHQQIINEKGWVSHDLNEIYHNTIQVVKNLVEKAGIQKEEIACLGISNQRETSASWSRESGEPLAPAIVWQCSRAEEICERIKTNVMIDPAREQTVNGGVAEIIRLKSGMNLSPYFPASKFAWLQENVEAVKKAKKNDDLCLGTIDTPIPICGIVGDSQGALFGQGCVEKGMVKATYGTGSSVMMNVGETPIQSELGLVTSLAWGMNGKVNYVLEGNINYTGAVITWLKNDMGLIRSPGETQEMAVEANRNDTTYLVPAFSGLGAPYWQPNAKAMMYGMSRTTGKKEIVKAALESIAYQITDIVEMMKAEDGIEVKELCVDGGPTKNQYLMKFQSDILGTTVTLPKCEESSALGAGLMAGLQTGMYTMDTVTARINRNQYIPSMAHAEREAKYLGWKKAVSKVLV